MQTDMICVVEDGGTRGRDVPVVVGKSIRVPKGESLTIRLDVIYASGAPVDLAGKVLTMTVRQVPGGDALFQKTATFPGDRGKAQIAVTAATTQSKDAGTYLYDIWLDFGSGRKERIVPLRPLVLLPSLLTSG